jgi:hypothetical protein
MTTGVLHEPAAGLPGAAGRRSACTGCCGEGCTMVPGMYEGLLAGGQAAAGSTFQLRMRQLKDRP